MPPLVRLPVVRELLPLPSRVRSCGMWCLLFSLLTAPDIAQGVDDEREAPAFGREVSPLVEELFEGGLDFLVAQQQANGSWQTSPTYGSHAAGGTAICTLALLARGDDPNWGPYAEQVRRGLRFVIGEQGASGRFKGNSYDYAFSMLLLAEACGVVDDQMLWQGVAEGKSRRSITEALELAVRGAVLPSSETRLRHAGWYSTASNWKDGKPDTSVAGSVLIGCWPHGMLASVFLTGRWIWRLNILREARRPMEPWRITTTRVASAVQSAGQPS